ncbi:MAG: hypothetical protein WKF47_14095 [Geodermatophilaceae bacterium]|jgi:hypothetical protein
MSKPDEDVSATEHTSGNADEQFSDERPLLTTDDEAQTDDPVVDPSNS